MVELVTNTSQKIVGFWIISPQEMSFLQIGGFHVQESVALYCSTIKIPAFTKGKKQLGGIEVEPTRQTANVNIHVERVIGNIRKKYSILGATQPIDFVSVANGEVTIPDKIVTSCCALVNLCDSVVPLSEQYLNLL